MAQALIALGGNLGDVVGAFRQARAQLAVRAGFVLASSRLYRTAPLLPRAGSGEASDSASNSKQAVVPDYLNAACLVETGLSPQALLAVLHDIEHRAGRRRTTRWASRELDLDLLAFGGLQLSTDALRLPHPHLRERAFVLYPLVDIAPDFSLPPDGATPRALLKAASAPHEGIQMQAVQW